MKHISEKWSVIGTPTAYGKAMISYAEHRYIVVEGDSLEDSFERAELIVKAVNCHAELLEACKLATVYNCDDHCAEIYPVICIHERIRKAISKAERRS